MLSKPRLRWINSQMVLVNDKKMKVVKKEKCGNLIRVLVIIVTLNILSMWCNTGYCDDKSYLTDTDKDVGMKVDDAKGRF